MGMRKITIISVMAALTFGGCQQPTDVKLLSEPNTTDLEIVPVAKPDTLIASTPVDSAAILPSEQAAYYGQFLLSSVRLDAGLGKVDSFASSHVILADSVVRYFVRQVGFYGVDLGPVLLNGVPLVRIPHRITLVSTSVRDTSLSGGVEYRGDLTQSYRSNTQYTWTAPLSPFGALSIGIRSPDALKVLSPAGGSIIPRTQDLLVKWTGGNGNLRIIVSTYEPLTKRSIPVLELRPRTNTGSGLIPASMLHQFPRGPFFVFTFILSNRQELTAIQGTVGKILVQAASVSNSYVELR
jgi:hypothetical protein